MEKMGCYILEKELIRLKLEIDHIKVEINHFDETDGGD